MTHSELKKILEYTSKSIDPVMKELLISYIDERTQEVVSYQVSTGGKRLRPALAIICCKMLGGNLEDVLYPAACLEILHNYTLIIDDIVDKSKSRRKEPTLWFKYGKSIAEITTLDYAAALLKGISLSKKSLEVSDVLTRTMKLLTDGEILDLLLEQPNRDNEPFLDANRYQEITEKDHFEMVHKKTTELIKASCEIGGLVAGANEGELEALRKCGFNFGVAFQIRDDVLDIFGEKEPEGRKKGQDITEGKIGNIIVLLALKRLSSSDKEKLLDIIKKRSHDEGDISEAVKLIEETKALSEASDLANNFIKEAKKNLDLLPKNRWNDILRDMADYVIERGK